MSSARRKASRERAQGRRTWGGLVFGVLLTLASVTSAEGKAGAGQLDPALLFEAEDITSGGFERLALDGARSFAALYGVPVEIYTPGKVATRSQGADERERLSVLVSNALGAGHTVIVGVGYSFSALFDAVAPDHPGVRFVVLDDAVSQPNVQSLMFREEEGSYLVGALAAQVTRSGVLGFVGGKDIPLIRKFGCAFAQGAHDQRSDVKVVWRMTGTTNLAWGNPERGGQLAQALVAEGADVVYHAAGQTGDGVIRAATAAGAFAIGVDVNQNGQVPGRVLTSMLKRTDVAVFLALKDLAEGRWQPGVRRLGLKEGAIDWALDGNNILLITEERQAILDDLRFAIIAGRVKVIDYDAEGRSCPFLDFGPEAPDDL